MQTGFTEAQLAQPDIANSNKVLRKCVHCGFCTATCPTYLLLGDELDSPRGRIYLIKDMLEQGGQPSPSTVKHLDRCLSCLSCMSTCPSGVNYMHLIDHARAHIAETYKRPLADRMFRKLLGLVLSNQALFRLSLAVGRRLRFLAPLLPGRLGALLAMAPAQAPAEAAPRAGAHAPAGAKAGRVALLAGCVQPALRPAIDAATIRLLNRRGVEVVIASESGCCGALAHHMGDAEASREQARRNVAAWEDLIEDGGLDAILVNTSGCGTMLKDYGFVLRDDPAWADRAARIAGLARDVTEYVAEIGLAEPAIAPGLEVAYHSACSMQHGQKLDRLPRELLTQAGFVVQAIDENHLCCGSAGTYNLLQPELSGRLKSRKLANIRKTGCRIVASGNIGCMMQLASPDLAMIHTIELLDWATGGPRPDGLPQD